MPHLWPWKEEYATLHRWSVESSYGGSHEYTTREEAEEKFAWCGVCPDLPGHEIRLIEARDGETTILAVKSAREGNGTDRHPLRLALNAEPQNDILRLVWADWLSEQGREEEAEKQRRIVKGHPAKTEHGIIYVQ